MKHEEYMRRAIALAKQGAGWTSPNPLVGAVIVKDGRVIGEGYHERYGDLHAERNALAHLTESAAGATIYVTLEPCCHHGKQPPCTDAIIEQGITTVYIGSRDPNPLVSGKGVRILREHGITVYEDFLMEECDAINDVFFHYITTKQPYVVMKYAMTLDGKIATHTGASKWITGETAREHVQHQRGRYAAILAGIGTVLADDPMLSCRLEGAHQPLRIVMDSKLWIPKSCRLVQTAKTYPTMVACAVNPETEEYKEKRDVLQALGVEVLNMEEAPEPAETPELPEERNAAMDDGDGHVPVKKLLAVLGARQIDSILVEGGSEIHDAFRAAGVINRVACYIAPKIFGGSGAKTPVAGAGVSNVEDALRLSEYTVLKLGDDLLVEGKIDASGKGWI